LYELSGDERVRTEYEMRQKAWRDRMSQNEGYYLDGVQKGRQESMLEIAQKMKKQGIPANQIVELTDLSLEEIAKL
jgi:predicted transposase/invertase (TIGR01784 family)